MSVWIGVKVMAELVTALGGSIFLSGLVLRGRARDAAIRFGAALVGISGLIVLLECLCGFLDPNRYPFAITMLLFGTGVTTRTVLKHGSSADSR